MQQAGDKGAGAGKGVDNVHAFVLQAAAELVLQYVFHAADNKIHYFYGGVNDAEAFGHAREGVAEEFVVQFHHDFLLAFGGFNAAGAQMHGIVKRLQGVALFVQVFGLQQIQHFLHGAAHGVVFGKAVLIE